MSGRQRHLGFIRAVMQGREGLTRDVLVAAVAEAGGGDPRTHLSTGNVSFEAVDGLAVCAALEEHLTALLGRSTPVLHRSLTAVQGLVARSPFADADPGEHLVTLAADDLGPTLVDLDFPDGLQLLGVDGPDAWFVRTDSSRPHPMPLLERAGIDPLTSRSIGTLEHLAARAG